MSCRRYALRYIVGRSWFHLLPARKDRARFIGCHVGPIVIRGCGRGCCPYRDSDIVANERYIYTPSFCAEPSVGPLGQRCHNPYRPKFVCFKCRRSFKPSVIDGNEYSVAEPGELIHIGSTWATWATRSESEAHQATRSAENIRAKPRHAALRKELDDLWDRYGADMKSLTAGELVLLRRYNAEAQWISLDELHCPGCGSAGQPVGGQFKAPKTKDEKGWEEVQCALENGEAFLYCMTVSEETELIEEAQRQRVKAERKTAWEEEKWRRIHALGLYTL